MKKFKNILAASAAFAMSVTALSAYAMPTNEFDSGMAKGIEYYSNGMYYEARDEFQWFCDANWGAMNPGQQQYALDYLDGAKANIQKWEQYLQSRAQALTGEQAINLIKDIIGSYDNEFYAYRYNCYDKGSYYLVNATVGRYANGTAKYRVYKDSQYVEFIDVGSSWAANASESFPY